MDFRVFRNRVLGYFFYQHLKLETMDSVNLAKIFKSSSEYATALQVLADPKQRQAGSLMSTLINYVTAIEYMTVRTGGVDFTLENWLENGKGFIFVTSKKKWRTLLNRF